MIVVAMMPKKQQGEDLPAIGVVGLAQLVAMRQTGGGVGPSGGRL